MRALVLSCEHASNRIPGPYQAYFNDAARALNSHRGIDFGAWELGEVLKNTCRAPYFYANVSRLLVDLNRSEGHPGLFSEYIKDLSEAEKLRILAQYYTPYRQAVFSHIEDRVRAGHPVLHLSIHSFTDVLSGQERSAEIGLLYDPSYVEEQQFAQTWRKQILTQTSAYRVKMNYPYLGVSDGFVSYLRQCFKQAQYIGLELEVNQALSRRPDALAKLSAVLCQSFQAAWQSRQTP